MNYYEVTDRLLSEEEKDPPRPQESDDFNEYGELPDELKGYIRS